MSSFLCERCGSIIIDSPNGYVTECVHYPIDLIMPGTKESDYDLSDFEDTP